MNIFQVSAAGTPASTSCAAIGVYFAIQFNGNMCFAADIINLQAPSAGGPPPKLYLNGLNANSGQPSLELSTEPSAAYQDYIAPSNDGNALFLSATAPGVDAPIDSGLILPGGTGINLTAGSTTSAQTLACLSGSNTVSQCPAGAANVILGVFTGAATNALIQTTGIATINLQTATTTTYDDYACSNATAGTVVDNGTTPCAIGQQVGLIAQSNSSPVSSVPVFLKSAGGGGSCSNCIVTNPSSSQTITPGNSSTEALTIQSNGGTTTDNFDVFQNGYDALRIDPYGFVRVGSNMVVENGVTVDDNQTGNNLTFGSTKDQVSFSYNAAGSGDIRGQITISAATSGSLTFPRAYVSAPVCVASPIGTTPSGIPNWEMSTSTTAVTITLSASAMLTFNYICMGMPN